MLSLSVRTALLKDRPQFVEFFPDSQQVFCCRTALGFVRKMLESQICWKDGPLLVSVIRIPDTFQELVGKRQYRIGELMMLAVQHGKTTEIPIVPSCVRHLLPVRDVENEPLLIDLRQTCPDILPDEVKAIVPDGRAVSSDY